MSKTIKVRAGDGRMVHFPLSVIAAPGRATRVITGDDVVEVPANMRFVRRRIAVGDLVVVESEPKRKPKAKPKTESEPKE